MYYINSVLKQAHRLNKHEDDYPYIKLINLQIEKGMKTVVLHMIEDYINIADKMYPS